VVKLIGLTIKINNCGEHCTMYSEKPDRTKLFTRGGQITFHNIRMFLQVNKTVLNSYLILLFVLIILSVYLITPKTVVMSAWCWCLSEIYPICELLNIKLHAVRIPVFEKPYYISPRLFPRLPYFVGQAHAIFRYSIYGGIIGFLLSTGPAYAFTKWLVKRGVGQGRGKFIRGSQLDSPQRVAKLVKKSGPASDITIDRFPLVKDSETKHFLVHGTTGSGKSQLIVKLLDCIRKRGDRVIIYDKGGLYTSCFYREDKDYLLNPFDSRSQNWSLWDEARTVSDFENLAESLIPAHSEHDPFWVNAARTVFGSAAFTMQDDEDRSIKKLLDLLLTAELGELKQYLSGTDAAALTSEKIEKTSVSIRSVIATNLKSLRFLTGTAKNNKPPFCIRDWIANEKDQGWLFLTSTGDQHAALIPLISMWFSIATVSLLSLPESLGRRIWFICDEVPTLNKQPQLASALAEGRKYGGCFVLGMQSLSQIKQVYGIHNAEAIYDLLNTAFYFRSPTSEVAEHVSKNLGSQEIEDMRENYSYGANTIRDGISISGHRITTPLVFVSEIIMLKDLHCYVRLPGPYPITLLNLKLERRELIADHFLAGELNIDNKLKAIIDSYETNDKGFVINKLNTKKAGAEATNSSEKIPVPQEPLKETKDNSQETKTNSTNAETASVMVNMTSLMSEAKEERALTSDSTLENLKKELPEIEFNILSALYSMTKENPDKGIEMNRKSLCKMLNRAKVSISRATTSLCQKDLIKVEATQRDDGRNVNVYRVNMHKIKAWKIGTS
jgi:type IV conjugative transfer system coupling protein TraD